MKQQDLHISRFLYLQQVPLILPSLSLADGTANGLGVDYGSAAADNLQVSTNGGATWVNASVAIIAAGTTSIQVRTPVVDDALNEFNETFSLTATTTSGVTSNASASASTTINDNDFATPGIAINDVSVNEAAGTVTFTVSLSAPSGKPINVDYSTRNGSATDTQDYVNDSGTVNFAPGETTKTITISINEDMIYEGNESFFVDLSNAVNSYISVPTGTGTIVDNEVAPTISVASVIAAEDAGYAEFTVSLTGLSASNTDFWLGLSNGTAMLGQDYTSSLQISTDGGTSWTTASNGSIAAGTTSVLVRVPVTDDVMNELDETFTLTANVTSGNTSNASATGTATIIDNDSAPSLSIADVSVSEAAGTATFTVTLSAVSGQTVTVNYSTGNNTAIAGQDYTSTSGTLTFAPGETSKTISVPIINDTNTESSETFNVNLTGAVNAIISDSLGVGTITDNDQPPVIDLDANNSSGATGANYAATFTENGAAVSIADTDISITDVELSNIVSATITLTNFKASDILAAGALPGGITASAYNPATGVITLSGNSTLANYQTAVRAITFANTSENPDTTPRVVNVVVSDGSSSSSNVAVATIAVTSVNDAAVISTATQNLTETNAPLTANGTLSITDVDSAATFVAQSGTAGLYGTFSIDAAGAWTYVANSAHDEFAAGSTYSDVFTVTSADGTSTSVTINIAGTNDAPVLNLDVNNNTGINVTGGNSGGGMAFTGADGGSSHTLSFNVGAGQLPDTVSATVTLETVDNSFTLQVNGVAVHSSTAFELQSSALVAGETYLTFADSSFVASPWLANVNGLPRVQIIITEGEVRFYASRDTTSTVLEEVFPADGSFMLPNFVSGINNITLTNPDDVGLDGIAGSINITVQGAGYANTFFENGTPVAIADADVTISDVDNVNMQSAIITLTNAQAGDVLSVGSLPTGITASVVGNVVTLSGSDTLSNYQAAIRAITFSSTSENPSTTPRNITIVVNDGNANSNVVTATINVVATNDAPVAIADNFTVTEGTVAILGNVLSNDTDVDSSTLTVGQFATDTFGTGATVVNGTNSITTALGGTVVMNADGTYTYTAPAFRDHDDASPDIDSFTYRATDGGLSSAWTTVSINIADTSLAANNDIDSLAASTTATGNVITGAGGTVVGGADVLGADPASVTNVTVTQGTEVSNNLVGNVRTIVTSNGTLVIDQNDGSYTYTKAPDIVVAAGTGATKATWTAAGFATYGYDTEGEGLANPYNGGIAANGIDTARLTVAQGNFVRYRNNSANDVGLGTEDSDGTGTSYRTQSNEQFLIDIGSTITRSATLTLTRLDVGQEAELRAYAADGSFVRAWTISGEADRIVEYPITTTTEFKYLVLSSPSGDSFLIDGLTVTPAIVTPDIFTYTLTDIDGSTSSATLTINPGVASVIDLDVSAAGKDFTTTFTQGGAAVSVADTDISITDADSTNITQATITLTNLQAGDVLAAGVMPGGIVAVVAGNVVTLTGSATLANYQTAIRAITFSTTSTDTTPRSLDVVVTDGINNSNTATTTVAVALLTAPVIDLDASASGTGFTVTYLGNGAPASIADTDISITDVDSTNITGATITLTNAQAGDVLAAGAMPGGITASIVGNVVTLTGSATLADYQAAIQAVTFENTTASPSDTLRIIDVTVTDGISNSNTAVTTIMVVPTGSNNTGFEDATYIPVTLTHPVGGDTAVSFNLSSLPANGALYLDAAMTILVTTGTDITTSGDGFLTLYFKPLADFNSGAFAGLGVPSFDFTAKNGLGAASAVATETITVTSVNDGTSDAINDGFSTVLAAAPITFTGAQLLANDTLFDHARITATGALPAGLTYNSGTDTYTYTPVSAGTASFTYTITDDEGQTDTATVTLTTNNAGTDLTTVYESALADGTGGGVSVVTGNLFTNDVGNTSISSINGVTPVGGFITVTTAHGTLVVDSTGAGAGSYTYTLNNSVDNDTQVGADTNGYVETFTYVGNASSSNLLVTIKDDVPTVQDAVVEVAQGTLPDTNLVFVVDISGSMAGEVKSVDSNGVVTIMNRLDAAKLALISVINEYYSQGGNISIKLVQFESTATLLNGGAAYASKEAAIAAVNSLALAGGTNYQDALLDAMTAFTMDGPVNTAENNTIYFISDGVPTSGDLTDPAASTGYRNFVNTNGIKSYAVGIASDISNPTELNNIHNVDSDISGAKDAAIIVTDVGRLDEVLLASVPTSFGGSVAGSASSSSLNLGADGGYISSLIMKLDTDGDNIADTDVIFTYDPGTNQISVVGSFPATGFPVASDLLTLNSTNGFTEGVLIFNFTTGEYTYQTAGMAAQGEQFDISFVATDMDGDTASGKQTIKIIDGKPEAHNDVDTLLGNDTFMEGNVITATGTDDGNNLQLTSFSSGRSGEDNPVDNAQVSSIVFNGVNFDLTTLVGSTAAAGGNYTVTAVNGVNTLTWTATTGGASLIFNQEGYYKYTPPTAELSTNVTLASVTYGLTSAALVSTAATAGMTLAGISGTSATEGSAAVNPQIITGVGVAGNTATRIDSLESLVINFDTSKHPHGVQGVSVVVDPGNSTLGGTKAFNYTVYNIHGDLIGQFASNLEGSVAMPASYTGIGKIVIDSGGAGSYVGGYGSISSVTYSSIVDTVSTSNFAPEIITYTLTDTDGDTSSATLRLNIMTDDIAGTSGNNTITGTDRNEFISGLAGDDTLNGGAGFDIIKGDAGNDTIDGGADDDQLYGGDGNDTISGGVGSDEVYGDAGDDILNGNDGDDKLFGGAGNDVVDGGAGADTISGGAGNDTLTGGLGADTFKWELSDAGVKGTPAADVITDFNPVPLASGGDVLDLRDLLLGRIMM